MKNKEYRPTLAQLRTFVTIAENRHFGTAAQKLGISQPSVSQALVALENGLDIQLIERSTRKVIVTPTGERLLPYAKATLEAADAFMAHSMGAHGTLTGPVTIGIIPTIAPYLLSRLLAILKEEYPEMEPRFVEEQTKYLIQQLRDGQVDLAIVALPTEAPSMVEIPLYTEQFALTLPEDHPLGGREDLKIDDLEDLNLLLLDDGHCLRDQVMELCRRAQINPMEAADSVTRAASLTTIMQLVKADLGATLVPISALEQETRGPGTSVAFFDQKSRAEREVGMIYRSSSSRAAEFKQLGSLVTRAFEDVVPAEQSHRYHLAGSADA